jgi:hypothetical protein
MSLLGQRNKAEIPKIKVTIDLAESIRKQYRLRRIILQLQCNRRKYVSKKIFII